MRLSIDPRQLPGCCRPLAFAAVVVVLSSTAVYAQKQSAPQRAQSTTQASPAQPPAQPIALRGGRLLTITKGTIENGVLVMENGKITAVGPAGSVTIPKNARIVDVTGMTVYPGLIDSESQLGLTEISAVDSTNDLVEPSDEITPHMHVYDAFHAESELIPVARTNGVTNAIVAPETTNTLPGQDSFIQLAGRSAPEMLLVRDIALPLNFTGEQRRRGGRGEGAAGGSRFPATRMGMAAQLRQTLLDAQDYARRWSEYEQKKTQPAATPGGGNGQQEAEAGQEARKGGRPAEPPKRDLKLEALLPYLQGKKPVVIAADEANDVQTAVAIAKEFNLKIVLDRVTHAQRVLDYIASLKVPVIVGTIYEDPKPDERYDTVFRLPTELYKRGVKMAFATYGAHYVHRLPYAAGYAVAWGLPHDEALKALTINPAEIWGVSDQLGSLEPGKIANVVVANGDPLDLKTDVKQVFIQGQEIPMTSRWTELRDRYSK